MHWRQDVDSTALEAVQVAAILVAVKEKVAAAPPAPLMSEVDIHISTNHHSLPSPDAARPRAAYYSGIVNRPGHAGITENAGKHTKTSHSLLALTIERRIP
jgi:hypothetical protein